jgi:hypothetical protein
MCARPTLCPKAAVATRHRWRHTIRRRSPISAGGSGFPGGSGAPQYPKSSRKPESSRQILVPAWNLGHGLLTGTRRPHAYQEFSEGPGPWGTQGLIDGPCGTQGPWPEDPGASEAPDARAVSIVGRRRPAPGRRAARHGADRADDRPRRGQGRPRPRAEAREAAQNKAQNKMRETRGNRCGRPLVFDTERSAPGTRLGEIRQPVGTSPSLRP